MRWSKTRALRAEPFSLRALKTLKNWNSTKVVKASVNARSWGPVRRPKYKTARVPTIAPDSARPSRGLRAMAAEAAPGQWRALRR
jgi:hypothetical protein